MLNQFAVHSDRYVARLSKCLSKLFVSRCNTLRSTTQPQRAISMSCTLHRRPGITYENGLNFRWVVDRIYGSEDYTVEALRPIKTGGRGPDGRIKFKHRSGGLRRPWFIVDNNHSRHVPSGSIHEEIVLKVTKNWWRHPLLALVASGEVKRWIVATKGMNPGDIIRSHIDIPTVPVDPRCGDVHPLGALPVGTVISQIELRPCEGASICRSAGASATVIRRGLNVGLHDSANDTPPSRPNDDTINLDVNEDDVVMIRRSGTKKLLRLSPHCMVVVGQVSNEGHNLDKFHKFGEKKWHGHKQRSGLWNRKTGRFGRKIRPIGPPVECVLPMKSSSQLHMRYTLPKDAEFTRRAQRKLFSELNPDSSRPKYQPIPGASNDQSDGLPRFTWSSWTTVR